MRTLYLNSAKDVTCGFIRTCNRTRPFASVWHSVCFESTSHTMFDSSAQSNEFAKQHSKRLDSFERSGRFTEWFVGLGSRRVIMVRRRARRTSIFSAMVLEIATLAGIVVIAQPTWSSLFFESVTQRPAAMQAATSTETPATMQQVSAVQAAPAPTNAVAWPLINAAANYVAQRTESRVSTTAPQSSQWLNAQSLDGSQAASTTTEQPGFAPPQFAQRPLAQYQPSTPVTSEYAPYQPTRPSYSFNEYK